MSDLAPQKINLSFGGLLQVPGGLTSSLQAITDGNGVASGLEISTTGFSGAVISDTVTITGGTINGTAIGATNPSSGRFSSLTVSTLTGLLKGSSGVVSAATANTDYLTPPSGTAILKANAGGALANATSGTDYAPATSGTSILKANGSGGFTNAVSGVDYAPATSGTSIVYGNGAGGFSNVTVGSGLIFVGGTLASVAGGGGTVTDMSVVTANGFAGTVTTSTTTPAVTLTTTVTGLLKGNGTAVSAATAGTDYTTPAGTETLTNKTLIASGGNTVEATSGPTSTQLAGQRNKIINGAMMIDQRNAGAAVTVSVNGVYTLDRWRGRNPNNVTNQFTVQQSTTTPSAGFFNSVLITNSSSARTLVSGDKFSIEQYIEGFNTSDLNWGTSSAVSVTLSFWIRSSVTGLVGGALRSYQSVTSACYPFSFTISAANTWQYVSVTIPGPTIGTWGTGTDGSIVVEFNLGSYSTFLGTSGTWAASELWGPTGAVSFVSNANATMYITGVQLEKGATATPFENRLYGTELALCQRYFLSFLGNNVYDRVGFGLGNSITQAIIGISQPVPMRAAPTIAYSGNVALYNGISVLTVTSFAPDYAGVIYSTVGAVVASGVTAGSAWQLLSLNNITARVTLSSEL